MANFLVMAAGSGIGQATVKGLRAQGHQVFTTARNGNKISPDMIVDASDFDAVDAAFAAAISAMGSIDGVVNCAGSLLLKSAHLTSFEQYSPSSKRRSPPPLPVCVPPVNTWPLAARWC